MIHAFHVKNVTTPTSQNKNLVTEHESQKSLVLRLIIVTEREDTCPRPRE